MADVPATHRLSLSDWAILFVLLGGSTAYLALWPQNLGHADESHFLYHSRRILEGALPYRDFFDFYTPLSYYGMALVFGLFGVQLATAKLATALLHGAIVALIYAVARRLEVRPAVAFVAAVAHLALAQPTWQHASPHWIASGLLLWLLWLLVRPPRARARLAAMGCITGVLASLQQQTGAAAAVGIAAIVLLERPLARRCSPERPADGGFERLFVFAGAAFAVTAVVLGVHAVLAGPVSLFEQIVWHPLTGYRELNRAPWGSVQLMTSRNAAYTFPILLAYLPPLLVSLAALRAALAWRARNLGELQRASTLGIFAGATVLSVLNRPDFIHLAFILPALLPVLAEAVEWALARLRALLPLPTVVERPIVYAATTALLVAMGFHLHTNLERARSQFAHPGDTRFGRVDFASRQDRELYERVSAALDSSESRELFCYPAQASLYLAANAVNPTRHEIIFPGYKTPQQLERARRTLEERRVPYVVVITEPLIFDPATDPIYRWIQENYTCAEKSQPCRLYRRIEPES